MPFSILHSKYLILIILCSKILAQTIENFEITVKSSEEQTPYLISDEQERKLIKRFSILTNDEFLTFVNFKEFPIYIKNRIIKPYKFSSEAIKLFKDFFEIQKKDALFAGHIFWQAKKLRKFKKKSIFPEKNIKKLIKRPRKYSLVINKLQQVNTAKEIVLLIKELERDHVKEPELVHILTPLLYSDLRDSVTFCRDFCLYETIYDVSIATSITLKKIASTESYDAMITFLKKSTEIDSVFLQFRQLLVACFLREISIQKGREFIANFIGGNNEKYEMYRFISGAIHKDDLKYHLLIKCKNNKNIKGFDKYDITQKLKKEFAKIPHQKKAIKIWFKKHEKLLIYDELLDKWDIADK